MDERSKVENFRTKDGKYKFKIVIGDWSHDGHNKSKEFAFVANYSNKRLQQAYKDSCALVGLQFNIVNSPEDDYCKAFIKGGDKHPETEKHYTQDEIRRHNSQLQLFTEYRDCMLHEDHAAILIAFDIPVKGDFLTNKYSAWDVAKLLLDFIQVTLPGLKWERVKYDPKTMSGVKYPTLNGWWDRDLNHFFGYGVFANEYDVKHRKLEMAHEDAKWSGDKEAEREAYRKYIDHYSKSPDVVEQRTRDKAREWQTYYDRSFALAFLLQQERIKTQRLENQIAGKPDAEVKATGIVALSMEADEWSENAKAKDETERKAREDQRDSSGSEKGTPNSQM